ncbi:unnamed protein product, partial [marine sediment metagenome]
NQRCFTAPGVNTKDKEGMPHRQTSTISQKPNGPNPIFFDALTPTCAQ